ncbi:MAG: SDR family oxidoreductase [Candidatus Rokubacteria bacterium]|nr:SDR family oxidoreductase [Candidatus Rokubacteria bacterium]
MPRDLRGAVVVVTGASSGIGAATAVACGREGMRVALAARRKDRLERVAEAVRGAGGEGRIVPTDVRDEAAVQALVDGTVAVWGRLDVLVNNAGVGILAPVAQTSAAEFEALMRVNFLGAVYGVLAALPHMRRQGAGHIVNVASVVGKRASPFRAAYVASKFALVGFSEALRMELRGEGIHVTCVCPVGTATEFHDVEANRLGVSGRGGPIQSAEHVARKIVGALRRPRPEVHPYPPARLLFLMNDLAPGLVDRLLMALSPRARQY